MGNTADLPAADPDRNELDADLATSRDGHIETTVPMDATVAMDAAALEDAGGTQVDAVVAADAHLPDATASADAGTAGGNPDSGLVSYYPTAACFTSAASLSDCGLLTDESPNTGLVHTCFQGDGVCSFADTCAASGCVNDAWLALDLGKIRAISRIRFTSDWWAKRPKNYEIWASNSPSAVPFSGAVRIATGVGQQNPWRCVAGESCADAYVPDWCCPNGRDAPQAPSSQTLGKYDIQDFSTYAARYWYLVVRDTYDPSNLMMRDLEYGGPP